MDARNRTDRRQLLAVLRSQEDAARVADRLREHGVPDDEIFVDDPRDEGTALLAEMHAEASDSVIAPQASFIADKQGFRGFWMLALPLSAAALALSFALALIDFGSTYWVRYLIAAGTTVVMAFTIALVWGIALGSAGTDAPAAAYRGVTVRVARSEERVRQILVEADPIRIDEIGGTAPDTVVFTEASRTDDQLVGRVTDTAKHMNDELHKYQ